MTIRGFWQGAIADPERIAIVDPDEQQVTAGQLLASANQLVHGLRKLGLQQGDCVAVFLPNSTEFLELIAATMQAGWYFVNLNNHLTGSEAAYILQDSEARVFISHESLAEQCSEAAAQAGLSASHCFSVGEVAGFSGYEALKASEATQLPGNRVAGQFMQYTSGTTGRPKGVKREVYPIDPDTMACALSSHFLRFDVQPRSGHVHLCTSPMYHMAPLAFSYFSLNLEHKVVLMKRWDAELALQLIERYKVTTSHFVPTQFHRLLQLPEDCRSRYDTTSLSHVLHAAAPCPPPIKRQMLAWWGPVIYEYYGSTEGGGAIANPQDWLRFPGTVGKAWEGAEVRIYDDDNKPCKANQVGNVYMKLQQDFEYKGDSEKTRKNRIENFFTVGDVGYLNEEDFLFLCDRKIDMIISGGVNIYPAEIEAALITHPLVADVAVFGIPNAEWGEEVKAVVELSRVLPNPAEQQTLEQGMITHCKATLAKYKLPKSVDFIATMPRDPNGKLYKRQLRQPYWDKESVV